MTAKDEALKLAKAWFERNTYGDEAVEVYEAIEQALAAPVQEPVAWQGVHDQTDLYYRKPPQADVRPLYTTPPAAPVQEPVAHDEDWLEKMYWEFDAARAKSGEERLRFKGFMRAYGTKCASTTPPAAPVQEPAGYFYLDDGQWKQAHDPVSFPGCTKLYTILPAAQRQWVGLTDEDRVEIYEEHRLNIRPIIEIVEAKLREKNT